VVARSVPKLFVGHGGALFVTRASRNLVEAVSTWGENLATEQVFAPSDCWALRRGRTHLIAGGDGILCRHVHAGASSGYVCIPLSAQGEMLGMLHMQCPASSTSLPCPSDVAARLASEVSGHLALALANLRLREALRDQAIRDPLTGLFNRRHMEETLERELRRAARKGTPLGVVMLDLDNFKRFNDTFGHEAGNTVLHEFGRLLKSQIRDADVACRYGGEEFVLIIPEAPAEAVLERAEHVLQSLKSMHVEYRGQPLATVSVSAGIAVYPGDGATVQDLVQSADNALYEAKKNGRDRVVARSAG
jgi:diguanylate cyclase (GGDEF)-like protein